MVYLAYAESLRRAGLSAASESIVGKCVNISKTVQDRDIFTMED